MVPLMKHICTPNGEHRLTQKLNCKDYGIYAACCKNCNNYYVSQTMTTFLQRRTKHGVLWNKFCYSENNDNLALLRHYDKHHKEIFTVKPNIAQCLFVIFIIKPEFDNLNFMKPNGCAYLMLVIRIVKLFTQHVVRGDYWVPTNCSLTVNGGVASLIAWLDHSCQKTEVGGKQGHAPCRKILLQ